MITIPYIETLQTLLLGWALRVQGIRGTDATRGL